jgi:phosphoenolpyruvate-protein kinase (PTS system EI component)
MERPAPIQDPALLIQVGTYKVHYLLHFFLQGDRQLHEILLEEGKEGIPADTPCGKDIDNLFQAFNTLATRLLQEKVSDTRAVQFRMVKRLQHLAVDVIETASVYAFG